MSKDDLCKTCFRWMDLCSKKDTIQRLGTEHAGFEAHIVRCSEYEKRNEKEGRNG